MWRRRKSRSPESCIPMKKETELPDRVPGRREKHRCGADLGDVAEEINEKMAAAGRMVRRRPEKGMG